MGTMGATQQNNEFSQEDYQYQEHLGTLKQRSPDLEETQML